MKITHNFCYIIKKLKFMKNLLFITFISLIMLSCKSDDAEISLSISGITESRSLVIGEQLNVSEIIISADKGISSFTYSINGGESVNLLGSDFASGDVNYTANLTIETTDLEAGNYTIEFILEDTEGNVSNFIHTLTLSSTRIVSVTGDLTGVVEWNSDNIYNLNGRVIVRDGATLNIGEGTIIKGSQGEGSLSSVLIVARGGILNINGTATSPVIFTSILDEIQVGQVESPNLDETDNGLWGGVIILGKGLISNGDGDTEGQIEGIPADEEFGKYGGSIADDNSGTMTYFSIRHGGTLIGQGNEINGLTLGGVGSQTTISHVEVVANLDDGIEFFGGSVNVTNALVWAQGDDGYDCDEGYDGTVTNYIYISGNESDHGFEIDGPKGTTNNDGIAKFTNGTFKGSQVSEDGEYADFRVEAQIMIDGLYVFNFQSGKDFEIDQGSDDGITTNSKWIGENPMSSLSNIFINSDDALTDLFQDNYYLDDVSARENAWANPEQFATIVTESPSTGLATVSEFEDWTLADAKGQLDDF